MSQKSLTDIKDIAKIIKYKYAKTLKHMTFVFCYKREDGRYLIFQELTSIPIQRFVYHSSNDSISFSAGWSAWGNPYSLVADGTDESAEVWADLFNRSQLYNTNINSFGAFNPVDWTLAKRKNTTEKEKKKKTKFDTIFEFRTDTINRVCFYDDWFEVYSSSLSFIALNSFALSFPYQIDDAIVIYGDEEEEMENYEKSPKVIKYNGRTFDANIKEGDFEPSDYWDINENDPENEEFDEYLVRTLLEGKEEIEGSLDVGQKKVDLLL